jgi:hypothetical protein
LQEWIRQREEKQISNQRRAEKQTDKIEGTKNPFPILKITMYKSKYIYYNNICKQAACKYSS